MPQSISIIIPVYNRIKLLPRSIDSILNQTHKNFELIIIDDCSNDDIKKIIKNYKDNRIKYIRNKKNMGVSYSRNIGIKKSMYDLIAFLDSDDKWLPDKLNQQLQYFKNNPDINIVHTEEIWIRNGIRVNQKKHHKKNGGDIFIPSLELCLMSPSSIMIKKHIFNKYGYFDESMPVCEDYDMWLRVSAFEKVGFISIPLLIKYGGHSDQLSRKYEAMDKYRVQSMIRIYKINKLPIAKRDAIIKVILQKSNILLKGALKRNKKEDANIYQGWVEEFQYL